MNPKLVRYLRRILGWGGFIALGYLIIRAFLHKGFDKNLYITEMAVALTVMAIGIMYWTYQPEIRKLTERLESEEKKHDPKRLNDNIFRKLTHIIAIEYFPYFLDQFGFCIQSNPSYTGTNPHLSYNFRILEDNMSNEKLQKEFVPMENAIPSLQIGENYLHDNYDDVYVQWKKIKDELNSINKDRQEFFGNVSDKILKELKKVLKKTPTFRLNPFDDDGDGWAYFQDVIPIMLALQFKQQKIKFILENPSKNQYYLVYEGYKFVGFNKIDEHIVSTVEWVFSSIIQDFDIMEKYDKFSFRLFNLNNSIVSFCKDIQNKVVNDIDHFK